MKPSRAANSTIEHLMSPFFSVRGEVLHDKVDVYVTNQSNGKRFFVH